MADSSGVLASLLLGQKQRTSPSEQQRKYGTALMQQGGSTAPLGSGNPLEGLARALQGGIGGFLTGQANAQDEAKSKKQVEALGKVAGANNQQELTAAIQGSEIDPDLAGPLMAQILQQKQGQFQRTAAADTFGGGYGAPTASPAAPVSAPQAAAAPGQAPPGFSNNSGNIRSTAPGNYNGFATFDTPQDGANAHFGNYVAYVKQKPDITLGDAIAKWSPPNENNTQDLVSRISQETGLDPRTPLAAVLQNPQAAAKLLQTQTMIEKGGLPQGFTPEVFARATAPQAQGQPQVAQVGGGAIPPTSQGDATPPMGSVTSQPPEVPRPQPTPEQIQRYRSLINSPSGISLEQANQGLNKEITDQWQADKARALAVWQDQQSSKRIQEQGAQRLGQEAPMKMIEARVSDYEKNVRPKAEAANNDILALHQVRQILDAGAFTGTGADYKTQIAKVGEQLGIPSEQAQNTQILGSVLANRTLAAAGGSLGTGFSNADRDFMEKAKGGQITMDEPALRRLADIGERQARQVLKNHDVAAERLQKLPGLGQLGADQFQVQNAPSYDEWSKANPLAPMQTGSATPQAGAPTQAPPAPVPGTVMQGYRFKGGNPADQNNWERAQ